MSGAKIYYLTPEQYEQRDRIMNRLARSLGAKDDNAFIIQDYFDQPSALWGYILYFSLYLCFPSLLPPPPHVCFYSFCMYLCIKHFDRCRYQYDKRAVRLPHEIPVHARVSCLFQWNHSRYIPLLFFFRSAFLFLFSFLLSFLFSPSPLLSLLLSYTAGILVARAMLKLHFHVIAFHVSDDSIASVTARIDHVIRTFNTQYGCNYKAGILKTNLKEK